MPTLLRLTIVVACSSFVAVLKEEVDDLSHLAPTPGDACIPLDETTSFLASYEDLNDLIDNYIYGDGVTGFEAVTAADIPTQHQQQQLNHNQSIHTDSYFASEPKHNHNHHGLVDQEMTVASACLSHGSQPHKPAALLKDAIISENVFAAAGLTVGVNNKMLGDEDMHCSGLDLMDSMIESAAVAVVHEKKMDPFITYRDESSDTSVATSHLLSPDDCSMQVSAQALRMEAVALVACVGDLN